MIKYIMNINKSLKTAKKGINHLRTILNNNDCLFHEILQENDLGIDGIIEFSEEQKLKGKSIAVQVKTGSSYINNGKCSFPIGNHREYWQSYALPVFGIVYNIDESVFYWVNIKKYLDSAPISASSITFDIMFVNTVEEGNFNFFRQLIFGQTPYIDFKIALSLIESNYDIEIATAVKILRVHHFDKEETWNTFLYLLRNDRFEYLHQQLISYFSYGTGNPDNFYRSNDYHVCEYIIAKMIGKLLKEDIIVLLNNIDEENGISRGSIGQCVFHIVEEIPNKIELLCEIIIQNNITIYSKEIAYYFIAIFEPKTFMKISKNIDSQFIREIRYSVKQNGFIAPY